MGSQVEGRRDAGGLLYMRNRYYDPATARFTQEDPIGLGGGLNLYGFAAGDPVTYNDPYGLRIEFVGDSDVARGAWNALARRAREARASDDPAVQEAGRQILAMMFRMQEDPEMTYLVEAYPFNGDEKKVYGHGYEGRSGYSRSGDEKWEVAVDIRGRDPIRALAHELGGAESRASGGEHDGPSVTAEDNYRRIRPGCKPRGTHSNNWAGPCP